MTTAILICDHSHPTQPEAPRALMSVAGLSLLERQLRQLARLGITRARVFSSRFPEDLHAALAGFHAIPDDVAVLDSKVIPAEGFGFSGDCLLVEDGVVVDDRILAQGRDAFVPGICCFPARAVVPGLGDGTIFQVDGEDRLFASVARLSSEQAFDLIAGNTDLATFLTRQVDKLDELLVSEIPLYLPDRRRDVPLLWRPVARPGDVAKAASEILAQAQKGTLDWPARFIHPPIENALTLWLAPTPVTPNMVTVFTGFFGFFVTWLFATGHPVWALVGALFLGVLDGVDGKLARTTLSITKVGELEHLLDKLVEYSWYLGIAYWLAGQVGSSTPWILAIMLILFAWAEVVQGEFFRRLTLRQLDDAGAFERAFRLVGGRRNTQMWALVPFAFADAWLAGLWVISFYAAVTFFVAQWRFIVRLMEFARQEDGLMAANLKKTTYW